MITCKDCYLYDGCIAGHLHCYEENDIKNNCNNFKNKNNYVEVIRCKDCKYFYQKTLVGGFCKCGEVCGGDSRMRANEGFCSYGELKSTT